LSDAIPKRVASAPLLDTATKCRATSASCPSSSSSQDRALRAFVRVSEVVNVLELTTNRVVSGSEACSTSSRSAPSTLDTKRRLSRRSLYGRSAW